MSEQDARTIRKFGIFFIRKMHPTSQMFCGLFQMAFKVRPNTRHPLKIKPDTFAIRDKVKAPTLPGWYMSANKLKHY